MNEDKIFIDTNVLVYAHDIDSGHKHHIAKDLLIDLWDCRKGVLSVQVLQEFYVTMTKKIANPLSFNKVRNIIQNYLSWEIEINDSLSVLNASRIEETYKISFWDGLIIAAASRANASSILTEDLQADQVIEGILIKNPFHSLH